MTDTGYKSLWVASACEKVWSPTTLCQSFLIETTPRNWLNAKLGFRLIGTQWAMRSIPVSMPSLIKLRVKDRAAKDSCRWPQWRELWSWVKTTWWRHLFVFNIYNEPWLRGAQDCGTTPAVHSMMRCFQATNAQLKKWASMDEAGRRLSKDLKELKVLYWYICDLVQHT